MRGQKTFDSHLWTRRDFAGNVATALAGLLLAKNQLLAQKEQSTPAQFARRYRDSRWGAWHLNNFLDLVTVSDLWILKVSLRLDKNGTKGRLRGHAADIDDILEELLWLNSYLVTYWTRDEWNIDYHKDVVVWCAQKLGPILGIRKVDSTKPTFRLEFELLVHVLYKLWGFLDTKTQEELLEGIQKEKFDMEAAKHAAKKGQATAKAVCELQDHWLLRYLPAVELVLRIYGMAGLYLMVGPILHCFSERLAIRKSPFPSPAEAIAKLLEPVWRILGIGGPNATKTLPFVLTLHCIKVDHQLQANVPQNEIFACCD